MSSCPDRPDRRTPARRPRWRARAAAAAGLATAGLLVGIQHTLLKPLPPGLRLAGPVHPLPPGEVEFLADVTWQDGDQRRTEQVLFDRVFQLIGGAEELLVLDLFLYNDFLGRHGTAH
ncbi:MAG: hypothetical protein ACKO3N_06655, partial [Verrucomicrobiota bacterium]